MGTEKIWWQMELTLPLQTQPDWKQQFGAKKEVWDGEEALSARSVARHLLPLWTALPLQVDFEKIRFGQLHTSIRRHPMRSGRPNGKSARAPLYSW